MQVCHFLCTLFICLQVFQYVIAMDVDIIRKGSSSRTGEMGGVVGRVYGKKLFRSSVPIK